MSFCFEKQVPLKTWKSVCKVIEAAKARGFTVDDSVGWITGGWTRLIWTPAVSNYACPWDHTSNVAPGARWLQLSWYESNTRDGSEINRYRVSYSVIGLTRDSRAEQHPQDLCPWIRVRIVRPGPQGEYPEWMIAYGASRGYPVAPAAFDGTQLQTVNRFRHLKWVCQWDRPAFPFRGYWWDAEAKVAYLPEPCFDAKGTHCPCWRNMPEVCQRSLGDILGAADRAVVAALQSE